MTLDAAPNTSRDATRDATREASAPRATAQRTVDNDVYDRLGERWYDAEDDPIALLRAESALRNPWIRARLGPAPRRVLDVGCGAGFLANDLAAAGHHVTGVDLSDDSLRVAARHDPTGTVRWSRADATATGLPAASFDAVCAMDLLEHVEEPAAVIAEAARVLVPGGLFFFHTFDRNPLAWLVVIKGVEWFVDNTPRDLHVLRLFLKPAEVGAHCAASGLVVDELRGVRPVFGGAFFRMLATGRVGRGFAFRFTGSTAIGYSGVARKTQ